MKKNKIEQINEWKKKNNKNYYLSFSRKYDEDIIEILDHTENRTDYIRQLIRSSNRDWKADKAD